MYYRLEVFVLLIPNSHTQFPCQLILLSNLVSVLYVFKCFVHCFELLFVSTDSFNVKNKSILLYA